MPSTLATGGWPFVARQPELALAEDALRSDAAGVVIIGPAGVGKSRLAAELASRAEATGRTSRQVIATRAAASMPLGALASLIGSEPPASRSEVGLVHHAVDAFASVTSDDDLLVVDDAHLLDELSALTLHTLASSARAQMILTVRSAEPVSDAIAALWKDGGARRVDLEPFGRADSEELVRALLEGPVDGAVLHEAFQLSAGNALTLCEVVRGSLEAGTLDDDAGVWRATRRLRPSTRLRDLLASRLEGISESAREALELVALGEPIHLDQLAQLTSLDQLEALETAGLVRVDEGSVHLAHPLYGDLLRSEMPELRSTRLHRRLADALDASATTNPADLVRATGWRLDSGGAPDPARMLAAAREAYFGRRDAELAERVARAAIQADPATHTRLLLAELLTVEGRHGEAWEIIGDWEPDDTTTAAQAALLRAQALFRARGEQGAADAALEEATRLDAGMWSDVARAQQAMFEVFVGDPRGALARVEPLLESSHPRVLAHATLAAGPALALIGRCDAAVEVTERGKAAQTALLEAGEVAGMGLHHVARGLALAEAGHLEEAVGVCRGGYDAAVEARIAVDQAWFALMLGRALLLEGSLRSAHHHLCEADAIFAALDQQGVRRWCQAGRTYAAVATGTNAPADDLGTEPTTPLVVAEPDVLRARAWRALADGDLASARASFLDAAERADAMGAHTLAADALHDLIRLAEHRSDASRTAAERLAELADLVDGPLIEARALHARGVIRRDADALEAAAGVFADCGARLFAAEALATAAAVQRANGSARAAERCAARSNALAARCDGARTPALLFNGTASQLTDREREVAMLAARGLPNRSIAAQLHISRRTVGNHLYRCFTKLGVERREDLAEALTTLG